MRIDKHSSRSRGARASPSDIKRFLRSVQRTPDRLLEFGLSLFHKYQPREAGGDERRIPLADDFESSLDLVAVEGMNRAMVDIEFDRLFEGNVILRDSSAHEVSIANLVSLSQSAPSETIELTSFTIFSMSSSVG
jgi:hypothetical protein